MKRLAPWILAVIYIVAPAAANSSRDDADARRVQQVRTDAGACYAIADADARAFCLAKTHNNSGRCYSIQSPSLRSQCLAEVRK